MAARSPPPLVSAPHGPTDRPTTTISTIVVKAGEEAFLTVGLLQVQLIFDLYYSFPLIRIVDQNGDKWCTRISPI